MQMLIRQDRTSGPTTFIRDTNTAPCPPPSDTAVTCFVPQQLPSTHLQVPLQAHQHLLLVHQRHILRSSNTGACLLTFVHASFLLNPHPFLALLHTAHLQVPLQAQQHLLLVHQRHDHRKRHQSQGVGVVSTTPVCHRHAVAHVLGIDLNKAGRQQGGVMRRALVQGMLRTAPVCHRDAVTHVLGMHLVQGRAMGGRGEGVLARV